MRRWVSELDRVQNCRARITIHYEGVHAFLEMNGGFMEVRVAASVPDCRPPRSMSMKRTRSVSISS